MVGNSSPTEAGLLVAMHSMHADRENLRWALNQCMGAYANYIGKNKAFLGVGTYQGHYSNSIVYNKKFVISRLMVVHNIIIIYFVVSILPL